MSVMNPLISYKINYLPMEISTTDCKYIYHNHGNIQEYGTHGVYNVLQDGFLKL